MIQLEKEKINSQKWKTPEQYTGNSLKTLSRRKRAKVQLAEKGFLGVFEYLDLQKQITADKASNETIDLTEEQSERYLEREEEESSDLSPEDRSGDAVRVDVTAAAGTSANVTAASASCATISGGDDDDDLDAAGVAVASATPPNLAMAGITTAATTKAPSTEIVTAPNMAAAIANMPNMAAGGPASNSKAPDTTVGPRRSVDVDVEGVEVDVDVDVDVDVEGVEADVDVDVEGVEADVDVDVEGVEVVTLDAAAEEGVAEVEGVGVEHHPNGPGGVQASKVVRVLISSVGCD